MRVDISQLFIILTIIEYCFDSCCLFNLRKMFSAGSNFSKTFQPTGKMNEQVELVRPLPFSSIVLFERRDEPFCLGTLINPLAILTSDFCSNLLKEDRVSHC